MSHLNPEIGTDLTCTCGVVGSHLLTEHDRRVAYASQLQMSCDDFRMTQRTRAEVDAALTSEGELDPSSPGRLRRAWWWVCAHFVNAAVVLVCLVVAAYFVRLMLRGQ